MRLSTGRGIRPAPVLELRSPYNNKNDNNNNNDNSSVNVLYYTIRYYTTLYCKPYYTLYLLHAQRTGTPGRAGGLRGAAAPALPHLQGRQPRPVAAPGPQGAKYVICYQLRYNNVV